MELLWNGNTNEYSLCSSHLTPTYTGGAMTLLSSKPTNFTTPAAGYNEFTWCQDGVWCSLPAGQCLPVCFPSTTTLSPTRILQSFWSGLNMVDVFWTRFSTGSLSVAVFSKFSFQNRLHGPHVQQNTSSFSSLYNSSKALMTGRWHEQMLGFSRSSLTVHAEWIM